ncbi:putative exported lipase/esterase [Stappia sp. 22II-S9-Z10]|nr:putative exported lipase/esterase [Stappia sp. 22II-S9-Z10]
MNLAKSAVGGAALAATLVGAAFAAEPVFDPTVRAFVNALTKAGGPPISTLSPKDARAVLDKLQADPVTELPATVERATFPVGPSGKVDVHIVRPAYAEGTLPAIMYFHGGGWILGNFGTHERLVCELAHLAEAAVVFVDYSPSPEAKFPVPIEEVYAATAYVAQHGEELGIDGARLAIAGDSVGGNMVAVVAQLAKMRQGPQIAFQMMFYPVTDAHLDSGSYAQFADGPWLTKASMEWFWDAYLPEGADKNDPRISPLLAPIEALRGLPPAMVITDENDVLRDEGEAYARRLMEADVPTVQQRYDGMMHDFLMLNVLRDAPPTIAAVAAGARALREALSAGDQRDAKATN